MKTYSLKLPKYKNTHFRDTSKLVDESSNVFVQRLIRNPYNPSRIIMKTSFAMASGLHLRSFVFTANYNWASLFKTIYDHQNVIYTPLEYTNHL